MVPAESSECVLRNLQRKSGKLDAKIWCPPNPASVYRETFKEKMANWMLKNGTDRNKCVFPSAESARVGRQWIDLGTSHESASNMPRSL